MNTILPPRKVLSLKKKPIEVKPGLSPEEWAIKEAKLLAKQELAKVAGALKQRLMVHTKATSDLKKAKHPMRIMCLQKMLLRLNNALKKINKLQVVYDDSGVQTTIAL